MSVLAAWRDAWRSMRAPRPGPLAVRQILPLDPRRRLALVACGSHEVILLIGGPQDIVVGWLAQSARDEAP